MSRIGMGLVGPGFAGRHHIDAVRRLGFVDVVAIAHPDESFARRTAAEACIPKVYGSHEELVADTDIDVVHNTTPNFLHGPVIRAAIAHRKHIISEKPLAPSANEALALWRLARDADVIHAVVFNYRGNPVVQQARGMVAAGDVGRVHFVHGCYLQDWLLKPTDYSWRLEPERGGASSAVADIGSHWCDLAQHVIGERIEAVLADLTTVVPTHYRPAHPRQAFATAEESGGEPFAARAEDLATLLVRFAGGAKGTVTVGQVCAGHKNDLRLEVNGATGSLGWRQERQNELWVGRRDEPNAVLAKDPSLLMEEARPYARLPGGHQEGWPDALCNVLRDIYAVVRQRMTGTRVSSLPPTVATFEDGYRVAQLVDAVLESHRRGAVWVDVHEPALAGNAR